MPATNGLSDEELVALRALQQERDAPVAVRSDLGLPRLGKACVDR